jgi:hypothetical protein
MRKLPVMHPLSLSALVDELGGVGVGVELDLLPTDARAGTLPPVSLLPLVGDRYLPAWSL